MCKPLNHDQEFFTLTLEQLREERVIPRAALAVEDEHDAFMQSLHARLDTARLYRDNYNSRSR